jgi:hypothetical protein
LRDRRWGKEQTLRDRETHRREKEAGEKRGKGKGRGKRKKRKKEKEKEATLSVIFEPEIYNKKKKKRCVSSAMLQVALHCSQMQLGSTLALGHIMGCNDVFVSLLSIIDLQWVYITHCEALT